MRKKTVNFVIDKIFWYVLYLLPVLDYIISSINNPNVSIDSFFTTVGISFGSENILLNVLNSIFGVEGVLPLFDSPYALYFVTWFASMMIIHLAVDFLLFIVRLAHKWLNAFTQEEI